MKCVKCGTKMPFDGAVEVAIDGQSWPSFSIQEVVKRAVYLTVTRRQAAFREVCGVKASGGTTVCPTWITARP